MKKRRTLIISLLLVAALALGIGYAAVSETLLWNGTIENDAVEFVVKFETVSESAVSGADDDEAVAKILDLSNPGEPGGRTVAPSVDGLTVVGDKVTFNYTVRNYSNVIVELHELTTDFNNEYFKLTVGDWDKTVLDINETANVSVTVELIKVSDIIETATFMITAEAVPYVAP